MNERGIAIIGVVVLFTGTSAAMALAHDAAAVAQIALTSSVGGGLLLTLLKLGDNTDKTEKIGRDVNGFLADRIAAAYREAYARGRIDGAIEEAARRSIEPQDEKPI